MKKFRMFTDFEKEEQWLNEMALKGWEFTGLTVWGRYCFKQAEPKTMTIRIDYRMFNKKSDYVDYLQLFADSGWRHIYGTRYSGSQYFIPERVDVDEDIFSDNISKSGRYHRLSEMWLSLAVLYSALFTTSILNGSFDPAVIFDLKSLYYTPGLWESTGTDFLFSFLFETPFAIGRGLFWIFELFVLFVSAYFTIRVCLAAKKYTKGEQNKQRPIL